MMTDEGCQTVDLEDGGAAEAPANFARQATNIGRDSYPYLNGTVVQGESSLKEASLGNKLDVMKPTPSGTQHTEMERLQRSESDHDAPRSTQIHPMSPGFLSSGNIESIGVNQNGRDLQEQLQAGHGHPPTAGEEAEDLYGASPAGRREEQSQLAVPSFHSPAPAFSGVETSGFEDQYGHWQSSIAQLSQHASPYHVTETINEDAEADRFYVAEGEQDEQFTSNGFSTSQSEMLHTQQYPEIDDGLPNQLSSWGPGTGNVSYPDLQYQNGGLEERTIISPPQPHSTAMSRSQSGQSQIVDLTESSDEEDEQPVEAFIEEEGSILEEVEGEESLEGSVVNDHEGSLDEEQDERAANLVRSRYFPARDALESEQDFEREGEDENNQDEYYDDDELEDDEADTLRQKFNVGPGQEFYDEEEEGSYEDEDEDTESDGAPARHPMQRDPVVIDLLSSDDEDDDQPAHQALAKSSQRTEEGEESEEDSDDENLVPYAERSELKIQIAPRDSARDDFVEEEDDVMDDERDQDGIDESAEEDESDAENEDEPSGQADMATCDEPSVVHELLEKPERGQLVQYENGEDTKLVDVEGIRHDDHNLQSETVDDPAQTDIEGHVETEIPSQFGHPETSPAKSGLFSRLFNFDGAYDEPGVGVSYPTLPKEPSPPPSDQQEISQTSDNHLQKTKNGQLLTPEATQSFGKTVSPETSFTSTTDALAAPTALDVDNSKMEIEQVEIAIEASGSVEAEADANQTEAMAATIETQKLTIHEEDIVVSQDGILETVADPEPAESEPLGEQTVEEQLNLEVTEYEKLERQPLEEQTVGEELSVEVTEPETIEPLAVQAQTIEEELTLKAREPESTETQPVQEQVVTEETVPETAGDSIVVDSDPPKKHDTLDAVTKDSEFTINSPRRSHRRIKSTVTVPNTKENLRPVTPKKPGNGVDSIGVRQEHSTPRVVLDSRAPRRGHDASIELALSSLESPLKQQHNLRKQPVADLKLRLSRALRTELSEFTALKVLRYHLNQKLDVLAVATTTPAEPLRAKNGPRHYQITFNITDPSIAPSGVTEVQIFRPYKDALPTIQTGDGILLRNFKVISVKNRGFGLRSVQDEGSSWAVFKNEGDAEVRGPPVEFGEGEKNHVIALKAWYGTLDAVALAKISRANGDKTGTVVGKSIAKAP
jgi:hypothetical protein